MSKYHKMIFDKKRKDKILDQYCTEYPSDQNAINMFRGEFISKMPSLSALNSEPGEIPLFEDPRITWFLNEIGGVRDQNVIELGPWEGGHTYMLSRAGTRKVVSIEANTRGYMKCLCIKEAFQLSNVKFLLGDFRPYLKNKLNKSDVIISSGVLYHLNDPIEFLYDLMNASQNHIYIWTHFYDENHIPSHALKRFSKLESKIINGKSYDMAKQQYESLVDRKDFCGGSLPFSYWISKESLLKVFHDGGFQVKIQYIDLEHPHGPCISLCATKIP